MMIDAEMYGMIPSARIEASRAHHPEHVEHLNDGALLLLEQLGQYGGVNTGTAHKRLHGTR
jgi:hypothetical protein